MMIDNQNIEKILSALDKQIGVNEGAPISIAVCGGTALFALRLILRTTKDVDVIGKISILKGRIKIEKIDEFPDRFEKAAKIVQRDFNLPDNWINTGSAKQIDTGLPRGFEKRLVKRTYGQYLTVYFISRLDQIHFKLYAALDRGGYHADDLFALNPSNEEILMASQWVLTQDVSREFRYILKSFLQEKGYENIAGQF
ncbi:DUF6036 family nucleotidyltransferase [Candidatus Auribacterota bacterium]